MFNIKYKDLRNQLIELEEDFKDYKASVNIVVNRYVNLVKKQQLEINKLKKKYKDLLEDGVVE